MYMVLAPSTLLFFRAIAAGAFLGICYDVFRIIRVAHSPGKIGIAIEDFAFVLICIAVTLIFFQMFTHGAFRVFILIGEFLGFLLYYLTVGTMVMKTAKYVAEFVKSVLHFVFTPFKRFFGLVSEKIHPVFCYSAKKSKKFLKTAKKHLPFSHNLLYNKDYHKNRARLFYFSKYFRRRNRGNFNEKSKDKKDKEKNKSTVV